MLNLLNWPFSSSITSIDSEQLGVFLSTTWIATFVSSSVCVMTFFVLTFWLLLHSETHIHGFMRHTSTHTQKNRTQYPFFVLNITHPYSRYLFSFKAMHLALPATINPSVAKCTALAWARGTVTWWLMGGGKRDRRQLVPQDLKKHCPVCCQTLLHT